MPLDGEGVFQALQHIEGVGIRAQTHGDAVCHHLQHRGAAHGVAHVGLGVGADHGAGITQDVHLAAVDVDAVAQHGLLTQQTVVQQAVHRPGAVVGRGVVHVVQALGHVDVEAGAAVVFLHHGVQSLVGQGEQGVAAEHGGEHGIFFFSAAGDEVAVFLDGRVPLFRAVPVRHLVAEAGAHSQLFHGFGDGGKRPFDPAVARVVVEDGGAAGADTVDEGGVGRAEGAFLVQSAVDGPPHALQYL